MSMPNFPEVPPGYTINDSIAQVITSIAMEEIGLSHIINAEGEKLQYMLGTLEGQQPIEPPTFEQILEINDSVKEMLGQISFSQMFLMGKMQAALNAYQDNQEPEPPTDADYNILAAAGTGTDPRNYGEWAVPFAHEYLKIGDYVSHVAGYPEFEINETGTYQINYQLAVYNTVTQDSTDNYAELMSGFEGILDSIHFTQAHVVEQRSITVNLQAGDKVSLYIRDLTTVTNGVNSQAISFIKVA